MLAEFVSFRPSQGLQALNRGLISEHSNSATFFAARTAGFVCAAYDRGQLLTRGDAESEDEDGDIALQKMDPGEYRDVLGQKKGGKKHPHQFTSKAAYEEYMSSIEYVPKGAFSYGRRLAGEDFNAGKSKKKHKMNPDQEWRAIEKIIAEKHKK